MLTLLMRLGLTEKEARVYLALLELAKDTVLNIAKKAGLQRATTYVILDKLIGLGLVSQLDEKGKTYFIAEDPRELEKILDRQQQEIELKRQGLKESLQQLIALHNRQPEKPIVRYYEGMDGLITLDRYRLNEPSFAKEKQLFAFMNVDAIEALFPARRKEAVDQRAELGVRSQTIYSREAGPYSAQQNKQALRDAIWLDKKYLPFQGSVVIHSWGIKFFEFSADRAHGVLIEDSQIASMIESLIKLAWLGAQSINKN